MPSTMRWSPSPRLLTKVARVLLRTRPDNNCSSVAVFWALPNASIILGMAGSPICLSLNSARLPSGVTAASSERIVAMARLA